MSERSANSIFRRSGKSHLQPLFKLLRGVGSIARLIFALALLTIAAGAQIGRIVPALDPLNALGPVTLASSVVLCIVSCRHHRVAMVMAGIAAVCSAERVAPVFFHPVQAATPAGPSITILSFNAWRHQDRPEETAHAIAASGVDIVLLQEAGPLLSQADEILKSTYPFQSTCPTGCDLAILSRLPVREFRYRIRDDSGRFAGPRIVFADIEDASGVGPVTVASIHVDRREVIGGNGLQLAKGLNEMFAVLGKENLIIGGDFNMTPYSFAFAKMDRAMLPIRRVSEGVRSYPSQIAGLPTIPVFAIDHIYASPQWQAATINVGNGYHSDHRPIAVRLFENQQVPFVDKHTRPRASSRVALN